MLLRKIFYIIGIIVFCIIVASCQAKNKSNQVATSLQPLLKLFPSKPSIGIVVEDLKSKQILYQQNIHRSFIPASTTKTLTATVALVNLP